VTAGDTDDHRVDGQAGHALGGVDGLGHRFGGAFDVDDRPLADAAGGRLPEAEHAKAVGIDVGDGTTRLGGSEVECGEASCPGHIESRV